MAKQPRAEPAIDESTPALDVDDFVSDEPAYEGGYTIYPDPSSPDIQRLAQDIADRKAAAARGEPKDSDK